MDRDNDRIEAAIKAANPPGKQSFTSFIIEGGKYTAWNEEPLTDPGLLFFYEPNHGPLKHTLHRLYRRAETLFLETIKWEEFSIKQGRGGGGAYSFKIEGEEISHTQANRLFFDGQRTNAADYAKFVRLIIQAQAGQHFKKDRASAWAQILKYSK